MPNKDVELLKIVVMDLVKALEDFRDHGTRHDTCPTGRFMECGCFNSFQGDYWQSYIRSQDRSVRERANPILEKHKILIETLRGIDEADTKLGLRH